MAEKPYRCGLPDAVEAMAGADLVSRSAALAALSALADDTCPTGNPGAIERRALRRAIEAVAALPSAFAGLGEG